MTWIRLSYGVMFMGGALVAAGILFAQSQLSRLIGSGSTTLSVIGFALLGLSDLPYALSIHSTWTERSLFVGTAAGYILLGVAVLVAIPKVMQRTQRSRY